MNRVCEYCGRAKSVGNTVSHSNMRNKRPIYPNLQKLRGKLACSTCRRTDTKQTLLAA